MEFGSPDVVFDEPLTCRRCHHHYFDHEPRCEIAKCNCRAFIEPSTPDTGSET